MMRRNFDHDTESGLLLPRRAYRGAERNHPQFMCGPAFFGGGATDPYFSSVSLLLHGDGTNGSTTFTDNSATPKTVTAAGSAVISTAQSKFGGASIYCPASSYVSVADSADFAFGSGNFTIEFWARATTSGVGWVMGKGNGSSVAGSSFSLNNTGTWDFYSGSSTTISLTRPTLTSGTWVFIAIIRSGSTISIYADGTFVSSGSIGAGVVNTTTNPLQIGLYSTTSFNGYVDDIRITKGIARANAVPTAAFPNS